MKQIQTLEQFTPSSNRSSVLIGGCFDIIHIGHIRFLKAAKEHGDQLIVALESDEFIKQRKHREPFHAQTERAEILSSIEDVDQIILLPLMNGENDYDMLVEQVHPNILAITEGDPQESNKRKMAEKHGAQLIVVSTHIPNKSSSLILDTKPSKTEIA